jgi:hypothetical protein
MLERESTRFYTYQPMDFGVRLGFPFIAKLLVAAPLPVLLALTVLNLWRAGRFRQQAHAVRR